jgi:heme a synthase
MPTSKHKATLSPWPHRVAVVLVFVVFPVIWMGGLVTTYQAGMAVPDWPNTYGYNIFLYPWTTWIAGPWNLFVEHGHRLLASMAGIVAIALVATAWLTGAPRSVKWLAVVALIGVILQGVLGGMRVLLDARNLALIHGCVGPAYFAFCVAAVVMMSPRWFEPQEGVNRRASSLTRSSVFGLLLAYAQLVLGAHLRHPSYSFSPQAFRLVLIFHIVVALALVGHGFGLAISALRKAGSERAIKGQAWLLVALLSVQLVLGFATLIVKYGWPAWLGGELFSPGYTVTARDFWSSMIVTAHVANGSLILATFAVLSVRTVGRFGWSLPSTSPSAATRLLGVAA